MGSDAAEVVQTKRNSSGVKAHASMCLELQKILDTINRVLPAIESAQPGCRSGIQELCSLNNAIEKAKLLLQHCAESSKLYLAITGEATLLRCERIRTALNRSLIQVQNMVPELLAAQIADIINYVGDAKFFIDPPDKEAGKVMLELLQQTDATAESKLEALQVAALKLNMTSSKALLIERRSIKKLLDKIRATDPKKEGILLFFLYLLKKYGNKLSIDDGEQKEKGTSQCGVSVRSTKSKKIEANNEPAPDGETERGKSSTDPPPEEFICPISSKLMFDPVVIDSGQTYEKVWIEKWFNEGNVTCPKTQKRLANTSIVPNSCMKDLISNWCRNHGVDVKDPCLEANPTKTVSQEPSHYDSISSLRNVSTLLLDGKTGYYMLQSNHSNVSIISSDSDSLSDSCRVKVIDSFSSSRARKFPWCEDYQKFQSFSNFSQDMYLKFFKKLSKLPLEFQENAIADLTLLLDTDGETCLALLYNGFPEALMSFMKHSYDLSDVQAQRTGAQILLTVLTKWRIEAPCLVEDAFQLLMMFLDSDLIKEALMIMRTLSCHPKYVSNIVVLGILPSVINLLDSEDSEITELAMKTICDLSGHKEARSHMLSTHCISKLVPLMSDERFAGSCIEVLRNLSESEEGALMIAETNGCIASIVELLDTGNRKEQEHAVIILHSLCLQSLDYRLLVMNEGVIPALCDISLNGSSEGREFSMKLLVVLRERRDSDCFDGSGSQSSHGSESGESVTDQSMKGVTQISMKSQPTLKSASGFFGRKLRIFSKSKTVALS
ncbi:hypothetical protein J5N97_027998 [Dioscorea zingiberensis]|uniref:RING-type E3 ubiquitin transferase n=1 Tax=Dioscorea zingiberensis TaxID=325984 RepID=A0A9D5BYE5_9LILI|nr:hypothetical protein J5N97_027998 [Dioscorea zingiberensis]